MAGVAGASAVSRVRAGSTAPGHAAAPGAPTAVQNGPAGIPAVPSSSRMTQMNTQKVQGGPISGVTQAAERTGITVGQTTQTSASVSTQKPSTGTKGGPSAPAAVGGQRTQVRPADTRFTQRPAQPAPKAASVPQQGASVMRQTTVHTDSHQHGPAETQGTVPGPQAAREPRPGRNGTPSGSAASTDARQHSPVQQEQRPAPGNSIPAVKGTAPGLHPGLAGTSAGGHQVAQARQTAKPAASVPTVTGTQMGKKAVSATTATVKGHVKEDGTATPSRKQRGKTHG